MRRWIVWSAATVTVLLLAIAAGVFWGMGAYYNPQAPSVDYPKPASPAESQRDDLDYLRKFLVRDWSYTDTTRAEAAAVIDRTLAGPLPLSRGAFELVVSRVVALADNGHTNVWGAERANRLRRLPVRFYRFADGFYVVRALPQAHGILGSMVVAIDGRPIGEVRQTMNIYTGGSTEDRDMRLPFLLEAPELLHAAGIARADDRAAVTVMDANGVTRTELLTALPPDTHAPSVWPNAEMRPFAIAGTSKDWTSALAGVADRMLLFADPGHMFVMRPLGSQDAFYIRFNANHSDGAESITDFAAKAHAAILAANPKRIVIDLRFNGGGDYTTTASFMSGLPKDVPHATIYVLEGPDTFSAGMTSAAFLKQAGGDRTVLVGSLPGDRIRFRSEGSDFCLPFSGICMSARTAIHDYSTTHCRPLSECYLLNWFYPVAIAGFAPQIKAPLTYAALSHGHDPALEAIFPGQGF